MTTPSEHGPDYSIVVPAYNEEAFIVPTLERLNAAMAATPAFRGELIVVDNASTDATAELATAAGAAVVHEPHRQIARARNAGAAHAKGRWLLFVDADTLITAELLQETLGLLDETQICYGGTHVVFDQPVAGSIGMTLHAWNWLSRRFTWACGAYVFCRRDAFEAVGGFNENVYASEEIGLCRQLKRYARRHGLHGRILNVPIVTSMRKAEWFTTWRMVKMLLRLAFWPRSLRQRDACWLWYERPEKDDSDEPPDRQ